MKLKYYLVSLVLLAGTSCNDGFLDRAPKDQLSDVSFWKDAQDATQLPISNRPGKPYHHDRLLYG